MSYVSYVLNTKSYPKFPAVYHMWLGTDINISVGSLLKYATLSRTKRNWKCPDSVTYTNGSKTFQTWLQIGRRAVQFAFI